MIFDRQQLFLSLVILLLVGYGIWQSQPAATLKTTDSSCFTLQNADGWLDKRAEDELFLLSNSEYAFEIEARFWPKSQLDNWQSFLKQKGYFDDSEDFVSSRYAGFPVELIRREPVKAEIGYYDMALIGQEYSEYITVFALQNNGQDLPINRDLNEFERVARNFAPGCNPTANKRGKKNAVCENDVCEHCDDALCSRF